MKKIAILLTVHNRKTKTLQCLEQVFTQEILDGFHWEVYLTNDGCTDGTPEAVAEQYPTVHIVGGDGTLFWNRGMYKAWSEAAKKDYDYYLWLNDDTYLFPNGIKSMINASEKENKCSIIVGSTSSAENEKLTYGGYDRNDQLIFPNGNLQSCNYFNGNCVLIPSTVYQKVGNLDYRYRHAIGDIDYGLRALKKGISLIIAPSLIGHCEKHDSYPIWCNKFQKLNLRLKYLYSPLGNNPFKFFIFEFRHFGLMIAIKHFFSIHLRAFIPQLWYKRKKQGI